MSITPLVSVFMPVYNTEAYLPEAIESILAQEFDDFELIAVDDGSTDSSPNILERYRKRDPRVRVHSQPNQGRVAAANKALSLAQGKYVARMDSDDISLKHRIGRQVEFLERNADIGLCGTWQKCFGERENTMRSPTDPDQIRCTLLFECAVWSGTIMFRRQLTTDTSINYRNLNAQGMAEDYDLLSRLSAHTKLANIPETLVMYRTHPGQSVQLYQELKAAAAGQIRLEQLRRMGLDPTSEESETHHRASCFSVQADQESVLNAEAWLQKLAQTGTTCGLYNGRALSEVVFDRWLRICMIASRLGMWTWHRYTQSPLTLVVKRSKASEARLALKCALRWSRDWESNG